MAAAQAPNAPSLTSNAVAVGFEIDNRTEILGDARINRLQFGERLVLGNNNQLELQRHGLSGHCKSRRRRGCKRPGFQCSAQRRPRLWIGRKPPGIDNQKPAIGARQMAGPDRNCAGPYRARFDPAGQPR